MPVFPIFLFLLLGNLSARAVDATLDAYGKPLVMPLHFYFNPGCATCAASTAAVKQAEAEFGGKVQVLWFDMTHPRDKQKIIARYMQMLDMFKVADTPGTAVFAGRVCLKDKEIPARLNAVIEAEYAAELARRVAEKEKKDAAADVAVPPVKPADDPAPPPEKPDAAAAEPPVAAEPPAAAPADEPLQTEPVPAEPEITGDSARTPTPPSALTAAAFFPPDASGLARVASGIRGGGGRSVAFFSRPLTRAPPVVRGGWERLRLFPAAVAAETPVPAETEEGSEAGFSTWEVDWDALEASSGSEAGLELAAARALDRLDFWAVTLAALADGVNPCAFATVVLLVAMMATAKRSRREILVMGSMFTLAVFLTYFVIGALLWGTFQAIAGFLVLADLVYLFSLALCVVCGLICLWDAVKVFRGGSPKEVTLKLPDYLKSRIERALSKGVRAKSLAVGTFVTGVLVSALESACTGAVFFPTMQLLAEQAPATASLWLGWYCFLFVVPLIAVFLAAFFGVSSQGLAKFSRNNVAWTKLALAVVFFLMGALLMTGVKTRWPPGYRPGGDRAALDTPALTADPPATPNTFDPAP